jgi:AraC-like DNA-binding protein
MARPKSVKVDIEKLEAMASIGCTYKEMADEMNCSSETLDKSFRQVIDKGRSKLAQQIRATQIELALVKKNVTMLIFLGKCILNQSDQPPPANIIVSGEDDASRKQFMSDLEKIIETQKKNKEVDKSLYNVNKITKQQS